jgi:hypothetical protein
MHSEPIPNSLMRRHFEWSLTSRPQDGCRFASHMGGDARVLAAVAICLAIVVIALISSPACLHWFLVPLFACGVICCSDGLLLFSDNGRNLFQPVPLVGAFGVYFFFIAPILHVATDYWFTSEVWAPKEVPEDWRPWLGLMAMFNLVGLGIYKLTYRHFTRLFVRRRNFVFPRLNRRYLKAYGLVFCGVMVVLQGFVYYRFDGIQGFVQAFGAGTKGQNSDFGGLGWLFALAESFPIVFVTLSTVLLRHHLKKINALTFLAYMTVAFVVTMLFGGLRGSRGNTIYTLAYILGIFHLTVRPVSRKLVATLAVLLALFMYVYGFYKSNPDLFSDPASMASTILSQEARSHLEVTSHRSLETMLMGDLDRADIQAYLLFRMIGQESEVQLAYGRTYVEGALGFIPYNLFHFRPPGKLKYGTDALYGPGTYSPTLFSTKIYGVAGETMLNFGAYSAPLGFLMLALTVGYAQALGARLLSPWDARRYFVPIASLACIVCVSSDLDNVIFVLLQHALMPYVLVRFSSGLKPQRLGS